MRRGEMKVVEAGGQETKKKKGNNRDSGADMNIGGSNQMDL